MMRGRSREVKSRKVGIIIQSLWLGIFCLILITATISLSGCNGGGGGSSGGSSSQDTAQGENSGSSGEHSGGGVNMGLPSVSILSPSNNQTFNQGSPVSLSGWAADPEDGNLPGSSLIWRSSRDGQLGSGYFLTTTTLSAGDHTITLTAKDSSGNTQTASVQITITTGSSGQTPIPWEKTFNKLGDDSAFSVQQTKDGGYIVAGSTATSDIYGYVLKLNRMGVKEWDKLLGINNDGEAYSIQQTKDGGYIVGGSTDAEDGSRDFYIVKLKESGELEWEQTLAFEANCDEEVRSIQQTADDGYIAAGYMENYEWGERDFYLVKLNRNGELEWQKTYDCSGGYEEAQSIHQTKDGGYIVAGYTYCYDFENLYGYLVKLSSNGQEEWSKILEGDGYTEIKSVRQTADGGYVAAGYTSDMDNFDYDCYVVKLNKFGDVVWERSFGRSDDEEAASVQEIVGGGYILAGYTLSSGTGGRDFYIVKLADSGSIVWEQTFGSAEDEEARSIAQTLDGGYIVAGTRFTAGGNGDFYLIKLESNGKLSTIGSP
ncbi:MAG: hypothetical protein K6U11_05725 [bacterium]|nr:hypothetical protein [bacterium]